MTSSGADTKTVALPVKPHIVICTFIHGLAFVLDVFCISWMALLYFMYCLPQGFKITPTNAMVITYARQ